MSTADIIRFLILGLYVVGTVLISQRLSRLTFALRKRFPEPEERGLIVVRKISGVLLWPLLWLLWFGWWAPEGLWGLGFIMLLVFFISLTVLSFLPWLHWTGIVSTGVALLIGIPALVLLVTDLVVAVSTHITFLHILAPALFALAPSLMVQFVLLDLGPELIPLIPEERGKRRKEIASLYTALILGFFKPIWAVENGEIVTRLAGNQFNGSGPSLVMPEPHTAVVTTTGSMITGVQGPEPFFINGEAPLAVLDLREQIRGERVRALTRNGIELEVPISTIFRIQGSEGVRLGEPWPYRRGAAYTALFAAEVDPSEQSPLEGRKTRTWDQLPLDLAKTHVQRRIADYHLDDIFPVRSGVDLDKAPLPRLAISGEVRAEVAQTIERVTPGVTTEMLQALGDEMAAKGVAIVGGSIGNRIVPVNPEIVKQRVEAWKARWMRRATERQAEAEANRYTLLERARHTVLRHVIQELSKAQDEVAKLDPRRRSNLVALRLLDILDHIANSEEAESLTPEAPRTAIRLIRQRFAAQTEILERETGGRA